MYEIPIKDKSKYYANLLLIEDKNDSLLINHMNHYVFRFAIFEYINNSHYILSK